MVEAKSSAELRAELLVGLDPLGPLAARLEAQFGHLALFCVDLEGGTPVLGIKWRPAAFLPHPLQVGRR